jgi:RNA polymerase sigma-70 factor (ECF subfamily)
VTETTFGGIIAAARLGEEWAVAAVWRDVHPRLLRYLRVVAPSAGAEDLASDVWLEIAGRLARFDGDRQAFLRFAFTICRRRVIDAGRREARRRTHPAPPEVVAERACAGDGGLEARLALDAALERLAGLPRDQAEVILLRVVVGLDADSVGEILGKRPGTVPSRQAQTPSPSCSTRSAGPAWTTSLRAGSGRWPGSRPRFARPAPSTITGGHRWHLVVSVFHSQPRSQARCSLQ